MFKGLEDIVYGMEFMQLNNYSNGLKFALDRIREEENG